MQRTRSEKSRRLVLDAALRLFAESGFRATTVRDIAEKARVSIGNVYHHFADKEEIFRTLLDEFADVVDSRRFPFRRALGTGRFPDNLEALGFATRDSIAEYRLYFRLIYVDVVEFEGTHVRNFYGGLAKRFANIVATDGALTNIESRLRPGVSPVSALLLVSRFFFSYFTIEMVFNVPEPFGKDSATVVKETAEMLRKGIGA
ncbi:MAG TPA: TetR/AcrR family transcriptional regulator [Thermoanaerobaculia bacterium]